jgi:hypothetical protein
MDIFEIDPNPTFPAPVSLPRPGKTPVEVIFRFRHMDNDAYWAMLTESRAKKEAAPAFLARFVDGWEGENINAPFSLETLGKLVKNYPKSAKVIFATFEAELIGALEKN